MEIVRKVSAAIVGVIIIITVILLAKWAGDQIRQRFLVPKTPEPEVTTRETPVSAPLPTTPTATYSAIPSTGPNDWLYLVAGLSFFSGLLLIRLDKKILLD